MALVQSFLASTKTAAAIIGSFFAPIVRPQSDDSVEKNRTCSCESPSFACLSQRKQGVRICVSLFVWDQPHPTQVRTDANFILINWHPSICIVKDLPWRFGPGQRQVGITTMMQAFWGKRHIWRHKMSHVKNLTRKDLRWPWRKPLKKSHIHKDPSDLVFESNVVSWPI